MHDVVVTVDGPRALEAVKHFVPEVGILDIGLPIMDGYELAAELAAVRSAVTHAGESRGRYART